MGQYYDILLKPCEAKRYRHYDRSVDGDYMMAKLTEHSWLDNPTMAAVCRMIYKHPTEIYWVGDYCCDMATPVNQLNNSDTRKLHNKCWSNYALKPRTLDGSNPLSLDDKYLVNHTKHEYIDCNDYKRRCVDDEGWTLHPLSLLTAVGNGLGGGDYLGMNEEYIGCWAGDLISVEDAPPASYEVNDIEFVEARH